MILLRKLVVKFAKNRGEYFAEQLYHAMKGAGTNDAQMIRVIISRSEVMTSHF